MFTDYIKDMGTNEDKYNVTILIAEDEESNFLLLKTILKRHCNVLQARTGLELLKVFAEKAKVPVAMHIDHAGYKNAGNEWYRSSERD